MSYQMISSEEKTDIFERLKESELKINAFIDEAKTLIEQLISQYNIMNERLLEIEKGEKK